MIKLKKIGNIDTGKDVGQWGLENLVQSFWKTVYHYLLKLKIIMSHHLSIAPKYACKKCYKNAVFNRQKWKSNSRIDKLHYIYIITEYNKK